MQITGKVAVIAGGASGMGASVSKHLAKLGAKIIVIDQNENAAMQISEELKGVGFGCDVSQSTQLEQCFDKINQQIKDPIRICVNCAGIAPAKRIVGKEGPVPLDWFNKVIQVNLVGTFNVMRLSAHAMIKSAHAGEENGVIINTASIAAFEGQIGQSAYSASKGGIVAMTLPAAREFAQFGIRVLCVAPGLIDTPMMANMPDNVRDNLIAQTLFPKRFGKAEEFAGLVQHMIENPLLNGEVVRLDGGVRMV